MEITPELFLDDIFEIEADGMLSDIMLSTFMMPFLLDFDECKHKAAKSYIISVLHEFYNTGHLKVALQYEDETLFGFALLFKAPNHDASYLHKIFVYEQYRENGIGTNLLKSLCDQSNTINLICSSDKIKFYEKNGFEFVQPFETPEGDNFKLSKGLYAGLSIMTNSEETLKAPIFFLNDNDLKIIAGLN